MKIKSTVMAAMAWGATSQVGAQPAEPTPALLDPVVISAQRLQQGSFETPAAISVVTRDTIDKGGPQVNLSEALNRVPGISVLNRQNYAQDLQLSIRGFGARSTFGIRGVRLIVDGIPATMPDGQGQASNISLASVGRIEVLRGPMAQLYGNSAGGVVQIFTEDDADKPTTTLSAAAGPYHLGKVGVKFSTSTPDSYGLTIDASHFQTDGYREHSEAQRGQLNARWQKQFRDTHVSVVLNVLDQPKSQDPIGLTRAQFETNPRPAAAPALTQDARKSVRQQQVGTVIEHRLDELTTFTGRIYLGQRALDNALSIPPAAQAPATSSGGMVEFDRGYGGVSAQLAHRINFGDGKVLRLVGGLEGDRMLENRQGYLNNGGNRGALKRDERNRVEDRDVFAQASLDLSPRWTATAGVRRNDVRFTSQDYFIVAGNPDDSGGITYHATNPVVGLNWLATPDVNVYANVGQGFETPTFSELAYRNGATGLNTDLRASRSLHTEVGSKWKITPQQRLDLAVFNIKTKDEIVVDTNNGGRTTYKNVGRTTRRGAELTWLAQLTSEVRSTLSLTALQARFDNDLVLAGAPERNAFAELAWEPRAAWGGFNAGAEWVYTGRIYVNDQNSDSASAASVFNLRAGFAQSVGGWRFAQLIRVDNVGDHRYAGSVIVNDANSRYFEPALPRTWLLSTTARYAF
jgi:iron complex outermembrane receptor protein